MVHRAFYDQSLRQVRDLKSRFDLRLSKEDDYYIYIGSS